MLGSNLLKGTLSLFLLLVVLSSVAGFGSWAFGQQAPPWQGGQGAWGNHTGSGMIPCPQQGAHLHRGNFGHHGNQTNFGMRPYGINGTWMGNGTHNFGRIGNHSGFRMHPCQSGQLNSTANLPAGGAPAGTLGSEDGKIPGWVRNNAKWWSEGQMADTDFVQGMQFLIQQGIVKIPPTQANQTSGGQQIPSWVKTNAKWWSQGQISDDDFIKGMQYLVSSGIVKV